MIDEAPFGPRDRTQHLDWAFPIIGIILALGLAWGIGYLGGRDTIQRYSVDVAYRADAAASARSECVGLKGAKTLDCIQRVVARSQDRQSAEQNLNAQQRAASAGVAAAVVSALALFATAIGIYYVRETLKATLKAVEDGTKTAQAARDANRIARESSRGWLKLTVAKRAILMRSDVQDPPSGLAIKGDTYAVNANGKVKVYGDGPVLDVTWQNVLFVLDIDAALWIEPERQAYEALPPPHTGRSISSIMPGEEEEIDLGGHFLQAPFGDADAIPEGPHQFILWVVVRYRLPGDPADHPKRVTEQFLSINKGFFDREADWTDPLENVFRKADTALLALPIELGPASEGTWNVRKANAT